MVLKANKRGAIRNVQRKESVELNETPSPADTSNMTRFLIFGALFPPLALVIFTAPDIVTRHDSKMLDFAYFGIAYTLAIIPALILGAIDRKWESLAISTIAGAAMSGSILCSLWDGFRELFPTLMALLFGGAPAAVCSCVSKSAPRSEMREQA